jgi:Cu/Zn superoxide dismutase
MAARSPIKEEQTMTRTFLRPTLAILACVGALALASPSMAAVVKMKADLKASNEVPPTSSKGTGMVDVTYNTATKMLSWKGTYSGLTGPATAAHFHAGGPGKNGGVVVPIFQGPSAKSPFAGSKKLTAAQASQLMAGDWYVNIHTAANKGGEIRGQVVK